jgi:ABC-type Zn uptake system ZnuABC Zn-binding protein ZnuA
MKRQQIHVILMEPYFDQKTPNSIASQTGARVLVVPPSVGGEKTITDYFKLFDYNVNLLVQALKETSNKSGTFD